MIDENVGAALKSSAAGQAAAALVVQFLEMPIPALEKAGSVRERIESAEGYLRERLAELTGDADLPVGAVVPQGALGQALIRGTPAELRKLIRAGGPLAKAQDVRVRANQLVPGISPVPRKGKA